MQALFELNFSFSPGFSLGLGESLNRDNRFNGFQKWGTPAIMLWYPGKPLKRFSDGNKAQLTPG
jgi:hypothetical protein